MVQQTSLEKRIEANGQNFKDVISDLIKKGMNATAIAFHFDVSPVTIRLYAKKYGIKFKPPKLQNSSRPFNRKFY